MSRSRRDQEAQRITDAPAALADDQSRRTRGYLIQQGIRVVCIVLALAVPGPLRWVFAAGAVVLPYTAVLFANAGRDRSEMLATVDVREDRAAPAIEAPGPDARGRVVEPRPVPGSPGTPHEPRTPNDPGAAPDVDPDPRRPR